MRNYALQQAQLAYEITLCAYSGLKYTIFHNQVFIYLIYNIDESFFSLPIESHCIWRGYGTPSRDRLRSSNWYVSAPSWSTSGSAPSSWRIMTPTTVRFALCLDIKYMHECISSLRHNYYVVGTLLKRSCWVVGRRLAFYAMVSYGGGSCSWRSRT